MKNLLMAMAVLVFLGCGDEDENMECATTIDCSEDKEMVCDQPVSTELDDGTTIELRACTYITYEHCCEKTECSPR